MNFKKSMGILLSLGLLASASLLAACTSSESSENTTPATTEVPTEPATQSEATEPATEALTEALIEIDCILTVTDQDETPISNATIYLTHQNGQLAQVKVVTDEVGKVSVTLLEGTYSLSYENLPEGHLPDDTKLTVEKGTTAYSLKVANNMPNGSADRPFPITEETTAVKIPANTSYTYVMFNAMDRTIVIENTTLKVNYKSVEYTPDENGNVSVLLTNESPRDPGYFTLINASDAEVEATLNILSTPGSMNNPFVIESLNTDTVATVAKDSIVYYKWTATKTGVLAVASHTAGNHISMSNLANSTVSYFTNGGIATYLNVTAGDEILISVATNKNDKEPAEITFRLTEHTGTAEDSIPVWPGEAAFTLAPGASYTFTTAENVSAAMLQIKGNGMKVTANGQTLEPNEKGTVEIAGNAEGAAMTVTVENQGSERQEIVVTVTEAE